MVTIRCIFRIRSKIYYGAFSIFFHKNAPSKIVKRALNVPLSYSKIALVKFPGESFGGIFFATLLNKNLLLKILQNIFINLMDFTELVFSSFNWIATIYDYQCYHNLHLHYLSHHLHYNHRYHRWECCYFCFCF